MTFGLTRKQQRALDFIRLYIHKHGVAPSYQEMVAPLGYKSKNAIHCLVRALEERGHIVRRSAGARTIALADGPTYRLPPDLQAALDRHCREHGDTAACVVVDAVALHLDATRKPTADDMVEVTEAGRALLGAGS